MAIILETTLSSLMTGWVMTKGERKAIDTPVAGRYSSWSDGWEGNVCKLTVHMNYQHGIEIKQGFPLSTHANGTMFGTTLHRQREKEEARHRERQRNGKKRFPRIICTANPCHYTITTFTSHWKFTQVFLVSTESQKILFSITNPVHWNAVKTAYCLL